MAEYIEKTSFIEHLKKDPLFDLVEQHGITGVIESFPAADVQPIRWIPMTEKLPPFGVDVLVYAFNNLSIYRLFDDHGKLYFEDEYGYWQQTEDATHWMPLPEPPKDGET